MGDSSFVLSKVRETLLVDLSLTRDRRLKLCAKQGESDSIGGLELDKGWETRALC